MNKTGQIDLLRREHDNAINSYDFDRAERIEKQIKNLKEELEREKSLRSNRTLNHDERREVIHADYVKESTKVMNQRVDIQREYHKRFQQLQEQHTQELCDLALQHTMALERESNRKISEYETLLKQSKVYGKEHNYALAKQVYKEAEAVKEQVVKQRREQCNILFARQKALMEQRHEKEIKMLTEKQIAALENLDVMTDKIRRQLKNRELTQEVKATQRIREWPTVRGTISPRKRSASVARSQRSSSSRISDFSSRYLQ